jgi:hypothetical protein
MSLRIKPHRMSLHINYKTATTEHLAMMQYGGDVTQ